VRGPIVQRVVRPNDHGEQVSEVKPRDHLGPSVLLEAAPHRIDHRGIAQKHIARAGQRRIRRVKPPSDQRCTRAYWGMREMGVRTPDGHRIMFGEGL
jgi:hypothetical protein